MTGFSADWLSLREPADLRARNGALAAKVRAHLAGREPLRIVDLGAGTGANLRASAELFPQDQHWHLLDHAPELIAAARKALTAWADWARPRPDGLDLRKDGRSITVSFVLTDLSRSLAGLSAAAPHLVTASAFFDLASARFVEALAAECARLRANFYTVLSCDGRDRWDPPHPLDEQIAAGFRADQARDKGFGPALGNAATEHLLRSFRLAGYEAEAAPSPWRLGAGDAALVRSLAQGTAQAAAASGGVTPEAARGWAEARMGATCEIGHCDVGAYKILL